MTEKELVDKIIKGDKNLFKELVDIFKNKVLNVCYSILKNKEDAEDVSQEVFIEIYRSLSQFKWKSSLSTWVTRIAITRSLNLIKKRKANKWLGSIQGILSFSSEKFKETKADSSRTPFDHINDNETKKALESALNDLPENQRIAYSLNKIDGMSNKEICEIMNLGEKAIESLMSRAKKNLQNSLSEFYEKFYS